MNAPSSAPGSATLPPSSALRLTGVDALPLLHRISTNTLLDLGPGAARATLFCDFRGRLLHRAVVYRAGDGALWLLRPDAPGDELARFIDRHVFRDQVSIEDRSGELPVSWRDDGDETGESEGTPRRVVVGGETLALGAPWIPPDPLARVVAGRPGHGHEIVEEFHPFEVGLGAEVHLDKGCFTGQEALMRMITYDSVRRSLARLRGEGQAPATPADLEAGGRKAGRLTTVAAEPGAPGWVGLAVVRVEALEGSEMLTVAGRPLAGRPEGLGVPRPLGRP